jgi:hypothetical protein
MRFGPVAADVSGGKRSSPMRVINANTLSRLARKSAESASDLARAVHNLVLDVRDSYRPGVHAMRGPGPKRKSGKVRHTLDQHTSMATSTMR